MIEKPEITNKGAYYAGSTIAANERRLSRKTIKRLKTNANFWQGFHDSRPNALDRFQVTMLEDPTRPGGWVTKRSD